MSDFAAALGALQKSAERASAAKKSNKRKDLVPVDRKERCNDRHSGEKRRHPYDDDDDDSGGRPRNRTSSYPSDYRQLTVRVGFFCIGAQKGGTTWLHEMLSKCKDLSLPKQKEIHFWDWHRRKGLGWYSDQFPRSGRKDAILGEVTPCYMTLEEKDIREIHQLFPAARVIFLARNLVHRAWSALLMELRNAVRGMEAGQFNSNSEEGVDAGQLKRMEEEANPDLYKDDYFIERLEHSTHSTRSDYAGGLKRWLKYFSKEQVLIINYNDIAQNSKKVMRLVLNHIGVKDAGVFLSSVTEEDLSQKYNVATGQTWNRSIRPSLRKKMEQHLRKNTKEFNDLLRELGYEWSLDGGCQ